MKKPPTAELFLVHKIAALAKGSWSDGLQDWLAIIVTTDGGEIWTNTYMKAAAVIVEHAIKTKQTWVSLGER